MTDMLSNSLSLSANCTDFPWDFVLQWYQCQLHNSYMHVVENLILEGIDEMIELQPFSPTAA